MSKETVDPLSRCPDIVQYFILNIAKNVKQLCVKGKLNGKNYSGIDMAMITHLEEQYGDRLKELVDKYGLREQFNAEIEQLNKGLRLEKNKMDIFYNSLRLSCKLLLSKKDELQLDELAYINEFIDITKKYNECVIIFNNVLDLLSEKDRLQDDCSKLLSEKNDLERSLRELSHLFYDYNTEVEKQIKGNGIISEIQFKISEILQIISPRTFQLLSMSDSESDSDEHTISTPISKQDELSKKEKKKHHRALEKEDEGLLSSKKELDEMKKQLDKMKQKLKDKDRELLKLKADLEKSKKSVLEVNERNSQLKLQEEILQKNIDDLKKQLDEMKVSKQELEDLKQMINDGFSRTSETLVSKADFNSKIDELKRQLNRIMLEQSKINSKGDSDVKPVDQSDVKPDDLHDDLPEGQPDDQPVVQSEDDLESQPKGQPGCHPEVYDSDSDDDQSKQSKQSEQLNLCVRFNKLDCFVEELKALISEYCTPEESKASDLKSKIKGVIDGIKKYIQEQLNKIRDSIANFDDSQKADLNEHISKLTELLSKKEKDLMPERKHDFWGNIYITSTGIDNVISDFQIIQKMFKICMFSQLISKKNKKL